MGEIDMRTELEKERDERNQKIVQDYKELRSKNENTSLQRICKALGAIHGLSHVTIKAILAKEGIIK